ncbi:phosphotransferase family protein [Halogeometricum limi]|uniref:Phosphotransferase enzyme family protein n=1 Tax=Halogeometricum limi TaxID=555875 RepID=A0A1I6GIN6_9EURY|nr:phosphotransferase [Halogeometricum limi]SFR42073.1 Phosphotransferase enzyme family protein [Halogeometricum limi]
MDEVTAVVAREFPNKRVASAVAARRGNSKDTTLVHFADGSGVVVQSSADREAFETELALARAVRERTSVPTPEVLTTGEFDGRTYAVVELVTGEDLHERFAVVDDETRRRLAERFGRYLAELHETFAFERYGPVRRDGDELRAANPSWPAWFGSHAEAGIDALPAAFDGVREELRRCVRDADLPATPTPRLYPWDFRPGNAVYDGEGVAAVLDWGAPLAAAAGLSVAKAEHLVADWYVEDERLRAAFERGYDSVRTYPDVSDVYRVVAVVRSAVDSGGVVTRPRYPELEGAAAVEFHLGRLREWV